MLSLSKNQQFVAVPVCNMPIFNKSTLLYAYKYTVSVVNS
jgi:hypothetical protein